MRIIPMVAALFLLPGLAGAQEDFFSLEGLVVTVSPLPRAEASVANHVSVLRGEELRSRGIASVADVLRDVSGVDVVRSGSFGAVTSLFVRGGESDHTLVLVDGVQVNRDGGGFDFSSLSMDNVERIEVVRGPASALYGSDAMAGVIHVVTRAGRGRPQVRARVETASFVERDALIDGSRWSADVTGGSERFGYSASLGRQATDGVLPFNSRFERSVFNGRAAFAPDPRTNVDLSVGLTDRVFHRPTDGAGQVADRNAFDFGDEMLARLHVSRTLLGTVQLQGLLSVSEVDAGTDDQPDDSLDTDSFVSLDHFRRTGADVRASLFVGGAVVTVGGEVEEERLRSFSEFASSFGTSYGRSENERLNKAAFVHVAGDHERLALNIGGRLEDNERFGRGFTWQAGATVSLPGSDGTRVRASVGTAIKEPSFFENFATGFVIGNPDLDPERSRSWEVGIEHEISPGTSLQATYFDQSLDDLIQYTFSPPGPDDPNYFNIAGAMSRGLELDAEARWGPLAGGASYTWLDTEVTNSGFDSGPSAELVNGETLLRRPTHTVAVRGEGAVFDGGRVHTSVRFVGSRADRSFDPVTFASERETLPGYFLWTLGTAWNLTRGESGKPSVVLSLRAENLLDESYQEVWGFAAPGRQLYVGVSLSFGGGEESP